MLHYCWLMLSFQLDFCFFSCCSIKQERPTQHSFSHSLLHSLPTCLSTYWVLARGWG